MNSRTNLSALICCFGVWIFAQGVSPADGSFDHSTFTVVLREHVMNGAVDYAAIKMDKRFDEYINALRGVDPYTIDDDNERLAFWINAYNAFTIKLIADHYPVKSIRDITRGETGPWDIAWVELDKKRYSLNQIEHEIIRKEFDEPRIHMALVCAAVSCPPLRSEAYTGRALDKQLQDNTVRFLRDTTRNHYNEQSNTLHLSELFSWYGEDFVGKYGSAERFALQVMGRPDVTPGVVKYLPYDWGLNDKQTEPAHQPENVHENTRH